MTFILTTISTVFNIDLHVFAAMGTKWYFHAEVLKYVSIGSEEEDTRK